MIRVLVPRAAPASTAARLTAGGFTAIVAPMMAHAALPWVPPTVAPAALLLTSAAAARLAGVGLAAFTSLPCHCVGTATAAAAQAAGCVDVRIGPGTAQAVLDRLAGTPGPVLHLAGADRTPVVVPPGLEMVVMPVYAARLLALPALPAVDWVVLHSPRLAAHVGAEWDRLGGLRGDIGIAALSPAVAAAAGPGWRHTAIAATPDDDALLAALALACDK